LSRLTKLARDEIQKDYDDLQERIAELRAILGDPARIDGVIKEELLELKEIYGKSDDRRTEIVQAEDELDLEDLIAEEDMVIAITRSNYIKRLPVTAYREQRRGGIGVMGMDLKDEDYIEHLFVASTHDYILFFTNVGKVYRLKVHELPLGSRQSKGRDASGVQGMRLRAGDEVIAVNVAHDDADVLVVTENGYGKRTPVRDYPVKGRGGLGVKTVQLTEAKGQLAGSRVVRDGYQVMLISDAGTVIKMSVDDIK